MLAKQDQDLKNKKQRKDRAKRDVYRDALRTEWILMSPLLARRFSVSVRLAGNAGRGRFTLCQRGLIDSPGIGIALTGSRSCPL